MNKIKVLVVEDEIIIADNLCLVLEDIGYVALEPAINYADALEIIEGEKPDIAILDINLPGDRDGIDLAWKIREDYMFPFIFLTANSDAATIERVKKVAPPAYLLKPFTKEDIYTSIELALHNFSQNKVSKEKDHGGLMIKDSFFIKKNDLYHKIRFKEIVFLKSEHVYTEIFTSKGEKYLVRSSMNELFQKLPTNFYRTHRSYALNLDKIDAINSHEVVVAGQRIPISKSYRQKLMNAIKIT